MPEEQVLLPYAIKSLTGSVKLIQVINRLGQGAKHSQTWRAIHTICTLVEITGKRYEDAGLKDICIESGVVAEGSVSGVLDGRKDNRSLRFHNSYMKHLRD